MRSWKELPKKHTIHSSATAKPDRSPSAPEPEHYRARLAKQWRLAGMRPGVVGARCAGLAIFRKTHYPQFRYPST